jgi:hypothetical protein
MFGARARSDDRLLQTVVLLWRYFAVEGRHVRRFVQALASVGVPFTIDADAQVIAVGDVDPEALRALTDMAPDPNPDEESTRVPDASDGRDTE